MNYEYYKALTEFWVCEIRGLLGFSQNYRNSAPAVTDKRTTFFGDEIPENERVGDVSIVPVHGPIIQRATFLERGYGATSHEIIADNLDAAVASKPAGIVLKVSSPGGTVAGTTELSDHIASISAKLPVVAHTNSMAASGAYWLASACAGIYASPSSLVGSIGAITQTASIQRLLTEAGIDVETFRSEGATVKAAGNLFKAMTDDERASIQSSIDTAGRMFRDAVNSNRPGISADAFTGAVWYGNDAKALGLVDGVSSLSSLVAGGEDQLPWWEQNPRMKRNGASINSTRPIEYASSSALRKEFGSAESYAAYCKAEAAGMVGRGRGRSVPAENFFTKTKPMNRNTENDHQNQRGQQREQDPNGYEAEWRGSPALQAEFPDAKCYAAFKKNESRVIIRTRPRPTD